MKEKFLRFLRANYIIWAFLLVMLIIELTGVFVTSGRFLIRRPFMLLSVLAIFTCVLFMIKSQRGRYWCAFAILLFVFLVDLIFIVVFDMTGSTFDYAMLKLRSDGMAVIESVPINFVYVLVSGLSISLFMLLSRYYLEAAPKPSRLLPRPAVAGVLAAVLLFHGGMVYAENYDNDPSDLQNKLFSGSDASYYDRGIFGNFIDELYRGAFFNKVELGDEQLLQDYIFASDTRGKVNPDTFGLAKDYNVVTVLGETFEWFSFMHDLTVNGEPLNAYPGGFVKAFDEDATPAEIEQTLRGLFPNLYEFYDTSVVCLNHHSREKTDISENHSIIGNYPTNCYINYDYPQNTIPYSVPNVMRALYGVESHSFHDGDYTFYNRNIHHENALGFDSFTSSQQMAERYPDIYTDYGFSHSEHNLDGEMMEACKEEMFPADRRFNTYITTITMHGQFEYRPNYAPHYEKLFAYGVADYYADEEGSLQEAEPFIHYVASAMEFDRAIGIMMDYLKNTKSADGTPLIDKTLIVIFGDHNAYYQSLTNDVKDLFLSEKNGRNYTDLFRVPLMVHIGNQTEQKQITKFTTTTDIVPTIMELLGIYTFDNLAYGNSIFSDTESILYSRAYNVFVTDKLYFSSLNNIKYRTEDVTQAYIDGVQEKAIALLNKISQVNRIFYYDFLSGDREQLYYNKLRELNAE